MDETRSDVDWLRMSKSTVLSLRSYHGLILGFARWLLTERPGPLTEQQRKVVAGIEKGADECCFRIDCLYRLSGWSERATFGWRDEHAVELGSVVREVVPKLPALLQGRPYDIDVDAATHVNVRRHDLEIVVTTVSGWILGQSNRPMQFIVRSARAEEHGEHQLMIATRDACAHLCDPSNLERFSENDVSLFIALEMALALRIITASNGRIARLKNGAPGAIVFFPQASLEDTGVPGVED
jgi:hypothetical protein